MGKSIIQTERECYFCGSMNGLERHHIFGGVANRKLSETYGLWVWLCHEDHTGKDGAQYNKEKNLKLKQEAQRAFQTYYGRKVWIQIFKKNYLGDWRNEHESGNERFTEE